MDQPKELVCCCFLPSLSRSFHYCIIILTFLSFILFQTGLHTIRSMQHVKPSSLIGIIPWWQPLGQSNYINIQMPHFPAHSQRPYILYMRVCERWGEGKGWRIRKRSEKGEREGEREIEGWGWVEPPKINKKWFQIQQNLWQI